MRIPLRPSNDEGMVTLGRRDTTSSGCGPAMTFSKSAQSATVRARGPSWQYVSRL
jgi:hypothetical protein